PQNLSVSIVNKGFWRVYKTLVVEPKAPLKLGDYRLKAQIHDSILDQFREEHKEVVIQRKVECMHNPVVVHGRTLTIPVDIKTGKRWIEQSRDKETGEVNYEDACVKYKS